MSMGKIGMLGALTAFALLSLINSVMFDTFICIKLSRARLLTRRRYSKSWHYLLNMLCLTICLTSLKIN